MNRVKLARMLHDTVAQVSGVSRLTPAGAVEVSTQYAGGRVPGVRLSGPAVELQVAVSQFPIGDVAERVHLAAAGALRAAGDARPVCVVIADIDLDSLPDGRR